MIELVHDKLAPPAIAVTQDADRRLPATVSGSGSVLPEQLRQAENNGDSNGAKPARKKKQKKKIPSPWLTVEEVANYLNCSRSAARTLILSGDIPSMIVNRRAKNKSYRVRMIELERWAAANERQHTRQLKGE